MKKSTAFLTLAGVLALTGCTTKVMDDRFYETPKDESGKPIQLNKVPNPGPMPPEPEKAPLQNKRGSAYAPMTVQENDRIGLDDNAAPKTKGISKKSYSAGGTYVVKPRDTMGKIAHKNHVSLASLLKANNMTEKDARRIRVGQKLVIPAGGKVVPAKKSAVKGKVKAKKVAGAAVAAKSADLNADGTYTVRRGDNIPKIARKFGVRAKAIQDANSLSDEATRKLQIGQKLVIPVGGKAAVKPAANAVGKKAEAAAPVQNTLPPPAAEETTPAADKTAAPAPAANSGAAAPAPAAAADTGVNSADTATDFLSVGDAKTLAEFAAKHGTTVEKLRQLNTSHASSDKLEPGEYLFVPARK